MVSELVALEMVEQGGKGVLGPLEAQALFKAAADPLPPAIDPYWAREIGRKLGVDAVLFGSVSQIPLLTAAPDGDSILLNVDVYLMDVRSGAVPWTYGVKGEIPMERYGERLSKMAYEVVESLVKYDGGMLEASRPGCWRTPAAPAPKLAAAPTPAPTPTPKPLPPLTSAQKSILADLRSPAGLLLPGTIFQGRTEALSKEGVLRLRALLEVLVRPEAPAKIRIAAHVDDGPDTAKDLELTKQRAKTIKIYLANFGVEIPRISDAGYGSSRPVVPNLNPKSRALNRRTVISAAP
jgi:outer membrane protein OmpA-like peptidoglycan-associated protein